MPTGLETLKEELTKAFECPIHKSMSVPLAGAVAGCDGCVIQIAAIVTKVMGVRIPPKRDPGPTIPIPGDKTRHGAIYDKCREIGHTIADSVPPGTGFCLMLFDFSGPQLEYMCNAQRPDMIKLLAEFQEMLSKEQ